jgi:hypothetical protein
MPRILVAGPCAALPAQPEWHGGMGTWARPQFEIEARQPEPELSSASPSPAPPGPGPAPLVTAAAPPPLHAPAGRWCLLLARSQFSAEPQHWQSAALVYCALAMSFGRVAGGGYFADRRQLDGHPLSGVLPCSAVACHAPDRASEPP